MPFARICIALITAATLWFGGGDRLAAAEAADLVGSWEVDLDSTWDHLKDMSEVKSLSAEQQGQVKSMLLEQLKAATFTFTATDLTSVVAGQTKTESFTVTRTDGASIYTDDTAADGKVTHSRVDVAPNQLVVVNLDKPTEVVVLKRKAPTP